MMCPTALNRELSLETTSLNSSHPPQPANGITCSSLQHGTGSGGHPSSVWDGEAEEGGRGITGSILTREVRKHMQWLCKCEYFYIILTHICSLSVLSIVIVSRLCLDRRWRIFFPCLFCLEKGSHCVTPAGLQLIAILWLQPPKYWNSRSSRLAKWCFWKMHSKQGSCTSCLLYCLSCCCDK